MREKSGISLCLLSASSVLALCAGLSMTAQAQISKPEAASFGGHYYKVFDRNDMNWEEATAFCRERGGYLASITSAAEDQFAYQYIRENGYRSVLFGLTDQDSPGVWKWQNGETFSYANWHDSEPSDPNEHYGMYYSGFEDGRWNDGWFDVEGILCEWNQKPDLCSEVRYGGHRYQLYGGAATWQEAKDFCENLGGYLAIPDDSQENDSIFRYIRSAGASSAYFGIYDTGGDNWMTVRGTKPSYINWAWGEPNDRNEPYAMYYWKYTDGSWNDGAFSDYTDNGGYLFICEWGDDPSSAPAASTSGKDLSKAKLKLSFTSCQYNGKKRKPKVTVTLGGKKIASSKYSVKYANNKNVGTAKVTVTGKKGFSGSKTKTFKIKPGKKITISFDPNGGRVSKKTAALKYGASYGNLPSASRNGYSLKGWYTKRSGGKKIKKNTTVTSSKAHTLYAHWKKNKAKAETGTGKKAEKKNTIYGCVIAGCNSDINGYTKDGSTDFYNKLLANKLDGYSVSSKTVKLHIVNDSAPSRDELDSWIVNDFRSAKEDDLSFVYYSGHGRWGGENKPGLGITVRDNNYSSYYSYSRFLDYLGQNISGRIVLVVDACFSGGFVKAAENNTKVQNRICVMASSLDTQPSNSYLKIAMDLQWNHFLQKIAEAVVGFKDYITKGHHNYHCFTYALMEGVNWNKKKDFPADKNGDHAVTCYELKNYINSHMPNVTGEIPRFYLGRLTNQEIFGW